jgi:hypothetical protein
MYDNIGEKIKGLAVIQLILGIGASIFYFGYTVLPRDLVLGIFLMILGGVASYISSIPVYGLGEAICYLRDIRSKKD